MMPKDDPTIARIRATRHRISEQFDHDPQKLVAHYIALQEEYRCHQSARITVEASATEILEPASTLRGSRAT